MIIKESIADEHSYDGSSFRVNAGSRVFKQVCPTKDYFNGTYLSCCTIDKYHLNSCYTITISVQFVNFDAFSTKSSSNNQKSCHGSLEQRKHLRCRQHRNTKL